MQLFQEYEAQLSKEEIDLISTASRAEIAVYMKQCRKMHTQMLIHMEETHQKELQSVHIIHQKELENMRTLHQEELRNISMIHSEELTNTEAHFRREEKKIKHFFNSELKIHSENFTRKLNELKASATALEQKLKGGNMSTIRKR